MENILEVQNISKKYLQGSDTIEILRDVSLSVKKGETVAIIGPSGSGKSTLLSIMAGLDAPDSGVVYVEGKDIASCTEKELSNLRNRKISIVFQSFELVQFFNALENISLPLVLRGDAQAESKANRLLEKMHLSGRERNLPSELSGGEQQRVAIGRALASGSDIIFADEPTGNLDSKNGQSVLETFLGLVREHKKTLVIITHDMEIAKKMDKIYEIRDMHLLPIVL